MQQFQAGAPIIASHLVPGVVGPVPASRAGPVAAASRRPNTALRRIGTGHDPSATGGHPSNVNLQVDFRPVTQHGMTGMRTATPGQGRQFADGSFFIAELRNKITEVTEEIAKLQDEVQLKTQDQSAIAHLQKKFEDTTSVIHSLEGQLADYNLAHDKVRTGADLRDLLDRVKRVESQNEQQKQQIDELFSSRTSQDQQRSKLEEEIAVAIADEESCMSQIHGDVNNEYTSLKGECDDLSSDILKKDGVLSGFENQLKEQEILLRKDEFRTHFKGLAQLQEFEKLEEQRNELREECDANLTIDQMRERLQSKAKEDAVIIKATDERLRDLELAIEQVQLAIQERETHKENMKEFEDVTKKYEALYQRDKAMQEFIDRFESTRHKDADQKKAIQTRIVALMEHISEGIIKKDNLPTTNQVSAMENDLSFKSKELDASQVTLERVKRELDKRKAELEQVNHLADKIRDELVSLDTRAEQMQREMAVLTDIEGLKERETQNKLMLQQELATVKHKRAAIQMQVQSLSKHYESRKKILVDDDWKRLETLEAKLRTYAQTAYSLETHIASRKRESDFQPIRDQVISLIQQVNSVVVGKQLT